MRSTEDRYRTLLDASSALADQPTIKAVLHSLRDVLSSTSRLHGAELYVLSNDGDSLHLLRVRSRCGRSRDQDWDQSCHALARRRECLRNRNQFSSRTYRRKC